MPPQVSTGLLEQSNGGVVDEEMMSGYLESKHSWVRQTQERSQLKTLCEGTLRDVSVTPSAADGRTDPIASASGDSLSGGWR